MALRGLEASGLSVARWRPRACPQGEQGSNDCLRATCSCCLRPSCRLFTMAGLSCPGLDGDLREGVAGPREHHGDCVRNEPLRVGSKAWSREHFFASVGMALDPGNAVLAAALWALMAVAKAVHEPACYRSVCTDGSSRGCYTYIRVLVNLGIIRVPVHSKP